MEKITYSGEPIRVDVYLTSAFPYSRNFFHHLIQRDAILVNQKSIKKSYKLQEGDEILIESLERFIDGGILSESPKIPLDIKHETEDYLVIYKPKGVLSHPNSVRDIESPSVVGALYHHFQQASFDELPSYANFIRAGLLHRLDKETDGLMLIAKTEEGLAYFKGLFQQKSLASTIEEKEHIPLKKFYLATCHVTQKGEEFLQKIEDNLPFMIDLPVHAKVPHPPPAKQGLTKILHIKRNADGTVTFEVEILTGRTHQIRYHLSYHGLPIVGDYVYGIGNEEGVEMKLTAWKLEFIDNYGNNISSSIQDLEVMLNETHFQDSHFGSRHML